MHISMTSFSIVVSSTGWLHLQISFYVLSFVVVVVVKCFLFWIIFACCFRMQFAHDKSEFYDIFPLKREFGHAIIIHRLRPFTAKASSYGNSEWLKWRRRTKHTPLKSHIRWKCIKKGRFWVFSTAHIVWAI